MKGFPIHRAVSDAIQQIDAALFNGDTFDDPVNRADLKEYVERWLKRIQEDEKHEQSDEPSSEEDEADGDGPALRKQEPGSG